MKSEASNDYQTKCSQITGLAGGLLLNWPLNFITQFLTSKVWRPL
jgi:hypothetical protein